ncbi:glycosyltransferase [Cryobacterium suzukii]|uniref:D-inositol 3-phosphate glycosyltransferase n=1 Tax=Cryobacterium suzukii TaxID=1259198 RepID=A0A4R9AGP3_9MICO|nr:glycosyltransferase family 4 protein [Cryobacterium suzukii]TFD61353.1 glycosyltransferase [Cryobacterium suzukii]
MFTPAQEHVLFIVNSFPPRVGGLERHVADLADELVQQGHRVTVVTLADVPSASVEGGIAVYRIRRHFPIASVMSFPSFGTAWRLGRRFSDKGVTAVSTHTRFFPMSWVGLAVGRRLGVPVLHTEHGSDFVRGVSPLIALASRAVDVTFGRHALRRASSVLGVSEEVVGFVGRLAGVHANLFYNAIKFTVSSQPQPCAAARRHFVFVGRLVPGKGWDRFLEAGALLAQDPHFAPFTLDVLGDGPDRAALLNQIGALGLESLATAHGYVDGETVRSHLSNSVLVNPTTLAEGFQTTLLEALAGQGQIVTYKVPGAAKLKEEGAPVRIVSGQTAADLANAMRLTLDTPQPPYPLNKLEQWSWPHRAQQYLTLIENARG